VTTSYFIDSGDKIRYFFESDSVDADGALTVPVEVAVNKLGHALHWLDPVFREVTFRPLIQVGNEWHACRADTHHTPVPAPSQSRAA